MLMATSSRPHARRPISGVHATRLVTTVSPDNATPSESSDTWETLPPPRGASESVLIIGARPTETRTLARLFAARGLEVTEASSVADALAQLGARRWRFVLLDARWESELVDHAWAAADALRCWVVDPKRVRSARYTPLPLAQADVTALLDELE